jgi:ATP-dependent helicase/DNAse subunit B
LAEGVGLVTAACPLPGVASESAASGQESLEKLFASLFSLSTLAEAGDDSDSHWSRNELWQRLNDVAAVERLPIREDEHGKVRVLSAASVRALEVPFLFFAGLSERSFPAAEAAPRLLGAEDERLRAALRLSPVTERISDEMLLFYEVVTRATRRLYLSYAGMDDKGQPLSPSPFVTELEQCYGATLLRRTELRDLRPLPRVKDLCAVTEYRLQVVHEALEGDTSRFASLSRLASHADVSANIAAGLECISMRENSTGFTAWEGIIQDPAAVTRLSRRFGADYCWSPSSLEHFAVCPYRFFLEHVLGIEPLPELELRTDYLGRGSLLHEVLAEYHRAMNSMAAADEPGNLFVQIVEDVLQRTTCRSQLAQAHLELHRRQLLDWGQDYRDQLRNYDEATSAWQVPLLPAHFEVAFGPVPKKGLEDPLSTDRPLEISAGGEPILISGRIDRIDVGVRDGQSVFTVIDYKTGSPRKYVGPSRAVLPQLQLALYAMAVEELFFRDRSAIPHRAGYWLVGKEGFHDKSAIPSAPDRTSGSESADWNTLKQDATSFIHAVVGAIRSGQFPVYSCDEECTGTCPFRTVCRINHVRSLGKEWQP